MKMASGACSTRRQYCSDITPILPSALLQLGEHRIGLLKLQTAGSRRAWRTSFRPPAVVGFERVHHVVFCLALLDHVGEASAHRFDIRPELRDVGPGGYGPVAGDDRVEVERQRAVECVRPVVEATAL